MWKNTPLYSPWTSSHGLILGSFIFVYGIKGVHVAIPSMVSIGCTSNQKSALLRSKLSSLQKGLASCLCRRADNLINFSLKDVVHPKLLQVIGFELKVGMFEQHVEAHVFRIEASREGTSRGQYQHCTDIFILTITWKSLCMDWNTTGVAADLYPSFFWTQADLLLFVC